MLKFESFYLSNSFAPFPLKSVIRQLVTLGGGAPAAGLLALSAAAEPWGQQGAPGPRASGEPFVGAVPFPSLLLTVATTVPTPAGHPGSKPSPALLLTGQLPPAGPLHRMPLDTSPCPAGAETDISPSHQRCQDPILSHYT